MRKKLFFYLFVFVIIFFAYELVSNWGATSALPSRYSVCVDYLAKGVLYQGQPFCGQGPVTYWVAFAAAKLFGESNLQFACMVLIIILDFVIFLQILKLSKLKSRFHILLLLYLFVFMVLPVLVGELPTILEIFFGLCALQLLFTSKSSYHTAFAGVFFALSCLSKFTALAVLVASLVVYAIWKKDKRQLFFDISFAAIPFLAIMVIVNLIYPNVFIYSFFASNDIQKLSFFQTFGFLASSYVNFNLILFALLIIFGCFLLYRLHSKLSLLFLLVLASVFFILSGHLAVFPGVFGTYYLSFSVVLLLISIGDFLPHATKLNHAWKAISLALLIVIVPLLSNFTVNSVTASSFAGLDERYSMVAGLSAQRSHLRMLVEKPNTFVDYAHEKILTNTEVLDILNFSGIYLKDKNIAIVDNPPGKSVDEAFKFGLANHILLNSFLELDEQEKILAGRIKSGEFSLIIAGPGDTDTVLLRSFKAVAPPYCVVRLPNLLMGSGGRHWSTLLYSNGTKCQLLIAQAWSYYNRTLPEICSADKFTANEVVKKIFGLNNKPLAECLQGGALTEQLDSESCRKPIGMVVLTMVSFCVFIIAIVRPKKQIT